MVFGIGVANGSGGGAFRHLRLMAPYGEYSFGRPRSIWFSRTVQVGRLQFGGYSADRVGNK